MRIWGRIPICKTSIPDHEMDSDPHNLVEKGKKEVISGQRQGGEKHRYGKRVESRESNLKKRKKEWL
jgi:hypothetical protein